MDDDGVRGYSRLAVGDRGWLKDRAAMVEHDVRASNFEGTQGWSDQFEGGQV